MTMRWVRMGIVGRGGLGIGIGELLEGGDVFSGAWFEDNMSDVCAGEESKEGS